MAYDEDLAYRIREVLSGETGITEKAMFGGLAFLRNGNMAVAANNAGAIMVRVPRDEYDALLQDTPAQPVLMGKREMRGWVHVDVEYIDADGDLSTWVRRGWDYAGTLPAK